MTTMNKEEAALPWVMTGVKDLYIGHFLIAEVFRGDAAFHYHQGLEKICKAYIIASEESEYRSKDWKRAKVIINEIAKDEGHDLNKMIKCLIRCNVLEDKVLKEEYVQYGTGKEIVKILMAAYSECRYPTPYSISEKYPIKDSKGEVIGHEAPTASSEPWDFAIKVALELIEALEKNHGISVPRENVYSTAIKNDDWLRFRRVFFKDNI